MVHSKTHLYGLSNNFCENDKFEDRDPSKKFLTQKHVMQSQLVEEPGAWQPRKPIKIFENEKFQESDPSKKVSDPKTHTAASAGGGRAGWQPRKPIWGSEPLPNSCKPSCLTNTWPETRQEDRKRAKIRKRQKDKKDRKTKKLITRIAIIKFFHTTAHHHKSIQISEEKEYCA